MTSTMSAPDRRSSVSHLIDLAFEIVRTGRRIDELNKILSKKVSEYEEDDQQRTFALIEHTNLQNKFSGLVDCASRMLALLRDLGMADADDVYDRLIQECKTIN